MMDKLCWRLKMQCDRARPTPLISFITIDEAGKENRRAAHESYPKIKRKHEEVWARIVDNLPRMHTDLRYERKRRCSNLGFSL